MKELFLNADTKINIINIEVADLSAQERFMKLQHGGFQCYVCYELLVQEQYNSEVVFILVNSVLYEGDCPSPGN